MSAVKCKSCGDDIEPGQIRTPTSEGVKHDFCVKVDEIVSKLKMFIGNYPDEKGGSSYTLFMQHEGMGCEFETPILSESSKPALFSVEKGFGRSEFRVNREAILSVGYSFHHNLCMQPPTNEKMNEYCKEIMDSMYDTKPPEQEVWMVTNLVGYMFRYRNSHSPPPELTPFYEFADMCTKWEVRDGIDFPWNRGDS